MSLENPTIKITDWQNMTNRLAALEAVLGMTNKSVLSDAAGDLSSGIFMFDGAAAASGDVRILVKAQTLTLNTSGAFTSVPFTFPELASGLWKVYPVVSAVRAVNYTSPAFPKNYLRATIEGGPSANTYYAGSDTVSVKVFLQSATSIDNGTGGAMDTVVTLVAFCVRG